MAPRACVLCIGLAWLIWAPLQYRIILGVQEIYRDLGLLVPFFTQWLFSAKHLTAWVTVVAGAFFVLLFFIDPRTERVIVTRSLVVMFVLFSAAWLAWMILPMCGGTRRMGMMQGGW